MSRRILCFFHVATFFGMQAAKALALAGPRSVTLCDSGATCMADLGANFWLTPAHAAEGTPRDVACAPQLAELNPYTSVGVLPVAEASLPAATLRRFSLVICTNVRQEE